MWPLPKNPYKKSVNQKYKIRDHNLGYDFFTNNFYTKNCYTKNFYTKNCYTKNPSAGSAGVWWPVLCSAAHAPAAAGGSVAFWAGGLGGGPWLGGLPGRRPGGSGVGRPGVPWRRRICAACWWPGAAATAPPEKALTKTRAPRPKW